MKKLTTIIVLIIGMALASKAQEVSAGGGLFGRGSVSEEVNQGVYFEHQSLLGGGDMPRIPAHGESGNQSAPIGSGVLMLLGLGAAYAVMKKHEES